MISCSMKGVPWLRCRSVLGSPQCRCHGCRKIDTSKDARKKEAIGYYRIESAIALFCALLINIFVVSVFARGFYGKVGALDRLRPAWKLPRGHGLWVHGGRPWMSGTRLMGAMHGTGGCGHRAGECGGVPG